MFLDKVIIENGEFEDDRINSLSGYVTFAMPDEEGQPYSSWVVHWAIAGKRSPIELSEIAPFNCTFAAITAEEISGAIKACYSNRKAIYDAIHKEIEEME